MSEQSTSKTGIYTAVAAAVIVGLGAIYWVASDDEDAIKPEMPVQPVTVAPVPVPKVETPDAPNPESERPTLESQTDSSTKPESNPVAEPQKPAPPPLPSLNESDNLVKEDLQQAYQKPQIESLFDKQDLIRKFVVFVDNAGQGTLTQQHSPVKLPESDFKVIPVDDNEYILDPESYKRYDSYVNMLTLLNAQTLIDYFKKFEPLISQAYTEIGYQDRDFEESLIDAIDVALATPLVDKEIRLVAPSAMYKFADEDLEALKPIQKLLIRMGPENQLKVQAALEKVRKELIKQR
ncbi:DUF3014 domain-containing protein [Catenovulum adriaticum]|uniref:DUF3014 domain-containing protein n=1 Tax=Catenovulum adriaticum TaxID=2984846 RepID=A0ABY7AI46_9ALTE|nr:DUF3014 domain-containing protein [Catenovulum sp. TS8]WAJ69129.1 DUF3014 domain-containing protein [Catenovulum sp. TS8]